MPSTLPSILLAEGLPLVRADHAVEDVLITKKVGGKQHSRHYQSTVNPVEGGMAADDLVPPHGRCRWCSTWRPPLTCGPTTG